MEGIKDGCWPGCFFLICGAVLLVVMNMAEVHSHTGEMARQYGALDEGHSTAEMFRHGHQGYRENVHAEMGHYGQHEEGAGIIAVAAQIGLLLLGLFLWRISGRSEFRKWTGILLTAAGVVTLLPIVIALPVLALMAYFIYKLTRNSGESQRWMRLIFLRGENISGFS